MSFLERPCQMTYRTLGADSAAPSRPVHLRLSNRVFMTGWGGADYWVMRFCFQRAMGFLYLVAFLIAANQFLPLLGERGLLPVGAYLRRTHFRKAPSLFWLNSSDGFVNGVIWVGVALSLLALTGVSDSLGMAFSVAVWALLWISYLSLVNVGQVFYGFGWETLLLETGFLTIFFGASNSRPPGVIRWLLLWVLFRLMFGAGLIKIRADPCWRDLTCMDYHFETQPLPNPLSWYFHHLPRALRQGSVLFNHFVELIVPWFFFAPPPVCYVAGGLTILFQLFLILSGNLSWLNYATIVLCIPCFDDALLARMIPIRHSIPAALSLGQIIAVGLLTLLVLWLSIGPARNLLSRRQLMNASFEPLHLVNTYGAFGHITRRRLEVIVQGTDSDAADPAAEWREYEFKGKPGDIGRRPCWVSPYHYKLDWQMWFAAMSPYWDHPWFLRLLAKLLTGDREILGLMARNPFPQKPPRFIRAELYLYRFTRRGDPAGNWWERSRVDVYLPAIALTDPELKYLLRLQDWEP